MKNSDRRKFNKGIIFYLLEQRQNFYTIWHSKSSTGPIWSISIIFIHFQPISATAAGQTSCMNDLKKFSPPSLVTNLTLTLVKVSLYFCSGPVINWYLCFTQDERFVHYCCLRSAVWGKYVTILLQYSLDT